jgi:hypothetical protein
VQIGRSDLELASRGLISDQAPIQPSENNLVADPHQKQCRYEYGDWEISDGIARANTHRAQYIAKHGRSSIDGLTVQQLGPALAKELYGRVRPLQQHGQYLDGMAL